MKNPAQLYNQVNRATTHIQETYYNLCTHITRDKELLHLILTACYIQEGALLGWYPQVRGASIKNDSEGLWWSTNGNVTIILSLTNNTLKVLILLPYGGKLWRMETLADLYGHSPKFLQPKYFVQYL